MSKLPEQAEDFLKSTFESAIQNAPSVIFIDEIEIILPKREKTNSLSDAEKQIKKILFRLIDSIRKNSSVFLMVATDMIENIDTDLFKHGRMDHKIEINKPDANERLSILKIYTKKIKLSKNVDLQKIANETIGFVGADLALLVSDAGNIQ
jgi:transitional endoplasmic reticulum ATPase